MIPTHYLVHKSSFEAVGQFRKSHVRHVFATAFATACKLASCELRLRSWQREHGKTQC